MKTFTYFKLIFIVSVSVHTQVINNLISDAGDIAFTAYHNPEDGFSFVFLDHCPIGTEIRFVDEEWNGTEFNSENYEGEVLWTNDTNSTIAIGTVIHIENADNSSTISASLGTATEENQGFTLASSNDGIIAITGTRSNPGVFLAFFGDSTDSSLSGTGLTNTYTANQHTSYGVGYYSGPQHCNNINITECSERLNSNSNWTTTPEFNYPQSTMQSLVISGVLSLEKKQILRLKYSPNPVTDVLEINTNDTLLKIEIFNVLGQKVSHNKYKKHDKYIDLTDKKPGTYFIKCYSKKSCYEFKIQKI